MSQVDLVASKHKKPPDLEIRLLNWACQKFQRHGGGPDDVLLVRSSPVSLYRSCMVPSQAPAAGMGDNPEPTRPVSGALAPSRLLDLSNDHIPIDLVWLAHIHTPSPPPPPPPGHKLAYLNDFPYTWSQARTLCTQDRKPIRSNRRPSQFASLCLESPTQRGMGQ